MKETISEEIMAQRRLERLDHLIFFMKRGKTPINARRPLALFATHNLLTGFFQNSNWQTAWYCLKYAIRNSWTSFTINLQLFYYHKILRLSEEEIDVRLSE